MTDPSLKLVVAWSDRRNICSTIANALSNIVPAGEVRRAGDDAMVVHTSETAEAIRDRLTPFIEDDEGLLVVEFEKWSAYGRAVDAKWLLARGH